MRVSDRIKRVAKAVAATVAGVAGLATTFVSVLDDSVVESGEVGVLATALAVAVSGVLAVWRVPNAEV